MTAASEARINRRIAEAVAKPPEPPLTEPVPAPEYLVDGFVSAMTAGGVVKLPFFSLAQGPNGKSEQRIVLRLAVSVGALVGIHDAIGRLLAQLRDERVIVPQAGPRP